METMKMAPLNGRIAKRRSFATKQPSVIERMSRVPKSSSIAKKCPQTIKQAARSGYPFPL
jgi:hypothetical protein